MPFQTLYTIRTTGAPIQAHDYSYYPGGLLVRPLCDDGITPHLYPVEVPWDQYRGIEFSEVRLAQAPAPAPEPTPAPFQEETFTVTAQPTQAPTRTAPRTQDPAPDPAPETDSAPRKRLGDILDTIKF